MAIWLFVRRCQTTGRGLTSRIRPFGSINNFSGLLKRDEVELPRAGCPYKRVAENSDDTCADIPLFLAQ